jgi:hypothetical protein
MDGYNADIFLSSLGAPPFKRRHGAIEVLWRCANTEDVYPIAQCRQRRAFAS